MNRIATAVVTLLLLSTAPIFARAVQGTPPAAAERANVAGDWTLYLELNTTAMFRGSLVQEGAKLSGIMGDETAEYPVTGSVEGTQMKLTWSLYQGGDKVVITVTGKFEREGITGTGTIGNRKIEVSGQRTSK